MRTPWGSLRTSTLLLAHAQQAERWYNIELAREQMRQHGKEPRTDHLSKRWLLLDGRIEVAEPSAAEEAEWQALCAEIDYRIPTPKDPRR